MAQSEDELTPAGFPTRESQSFLCSLLQERTHASRFTLGVESALEGAPVDVGGTADVLSEAAEESHHHPYLRPFAFLPSQGKLSLLHACAPKWHQTLRLQHF